MARDRITLGILALMAVAVFAADLLLLPDIFMPAVVYALPILLGAYLLRGPSMVAAIAVWTIALQIAAYLLHDLRLSLLPVSYVLGIGVMSLLSVVLSYRARREARLREEVESRTMLLETVIENAPAGIAVLRGTDFVFEVVNPVYQAIAPGKQFLGKSVAEVWPELADQVLPLLRGVLRTGEPFHAVDLPLPIRRVQGGPIEQGRFTFSYVLMARSADENERVLVLVQETTQQVLARKRVEELGEASDRRAGELSTVIQSIADAVVIFDSSGAMTLMNPAAERLLGFSQDERKLPLAQRERLLRIETPEGKPFPPRELPQRKALRGEMSAGIVAVLHSRRGRPLWVTASAAPIRRPDGTILGAVLTFTDITPMHDLQQQRARHVLGISHGLRTPLTVIQGQAQLLLRGLSAVKVNGRILHGAKEIAAASQRMGLLLRDLVDLTALESGQTLNLNRQPIDLRSLVAGMVQRLAGAFETERISVEAPDDLPPVSADPDRVERVLVDLLSNAFKYSDPGTKIAVRISPRDGDVVVSVVDRGKGIPPGEMEHLFEPYQRRGGRPETTGLGLYIARGLVEAHGGRIWAESQPGQGSTFSFSIPVVEKLDVEPGARGAPRDTVES